ncbi:hypothetical protein ACFU0X_10220 [Streptomyces cellulosae]|uniref:Methyl-accepting transducer domain-containing protein n=1 Tax=Streptomyces cellulosae TaxID=1968 RepID=A0ABW6JDH3_STRCE
MSLLEQYSETWWLPGGRLAACSLVKIYPVDSNIPADLYADRCGSQRLPNPMRTDERGVLNFWAQPGKYWVHVDGRTYPITVGEQGCISPTDLDQKLGEHVQAADPHGDRAAANAALMHHSAATKGVHGIVDTSVLETKDGAQRKANEAVEQAVMMVNQQIQCHASQTRNVHGICDTTALETVNGAQEKANAAVAAAQMVAEQAARNVVQQELDALNVPDPENLETRDGAQAKANAARDSAIETATRYAADGDAALSRRIEALESSGGSGGGGQVWETPAGAQSKADTARAGAEEYADKLVGEHAAKTTDVHGIADTTQLATKDDVAAGDAKLQEQIDELKAASGGGEGGEPAPGGITEEQAKALADAARDEAVKHADEGDAKLQAQIDALQPGEQPTGFETPEGAQEKADAARAAAEETAQRLVDEHQAKTTDVHGIADTAALATKDDVAEVQKQLDDLKASGGAGEGGGGEGGEPAPEVTLEKVQSIANAARDEAKDHADQGDAALQEQIDELKGSGGGGGGETPAGAQAKADKALADAKEYADGVRAAAEECCKANADAIKAGDDALQAQIDELKGSGGGGEGGEPAPGGITEEQAKALADAARDEAIAKAGEDAKAGDAELQKQIDELKAAQGGGEGTPDPEQPAGEGLTKEEAAKLVDDKIADHVASCHTLQVVNDAAAVEAQDGWEVHTVERRSLGGSHTAFIRLRRTGENIQGKDENFVNAAGVHEEGNIVPDLLIAKLAEDWRPPQSYLVGAHTSYGSGSVRVEANGDVYLLDWMRNNVLQTGHYLRFEYEWLTQSPCQGGGEGSGEGGGAPVAGVTEERAKELADAARDEAVAKAEECCKANADAIKAGDDALQAQIDELKAGQGGGEGGGEGGEPGTWETPEQAQAKADKARDEAKAYADELLKKHVDACHTLVINGDKSLVEAAEGWETHLVEHRHRGGTHTVFIRMKRTGEPVESAPLGTKGKNGDPQSGNLPDMLLGKLAEEIWPPQPFLVSAHTSNGSGSVRIQPTGDAHLLDWTIDNALGTGHYLRFQYEWLDKSACEGAPADGDQGGGTEGQGPDTQPAPTTPAEVSRQELTEELQRLVASYPSAYNLSMRETQTKMTGTSGDRWVVWPMSGRKKAAADSAEGLSVTLRVPPSLKLRVATSMRASNSTSQLAQVHQAVEVWKGSEQVLKAGDLPIVTASLVRLNETDSVSRCFHVDFSKVGGGAVKAGDEVTLLVVNRTTLGEVLLLERDVAAESLLA